MVDDDHFDPRRLGLGDRIERLRAAIDRDDELRSRLTDFDERGARRAIAFHQPVGDIGADGKAEPAQQPHEQRRRGCAVDVVIAKDRDGLALLDRVGEPRGGGVHVPEK